MANSKITWANKESLVTDPTIAEKNKVTDSNMNEIKSVVNENADQLIVSDTEPTSNENEIWLDTSDTTPYVNSEISNNYGNAQNLGYSQEYQNKHNVVVSPTTPTTSERVWFKKSKNLFQGGYTTTSNGITFTKNSDGTYNISGTANGSAVCDLYIPIASSGIINGETYTLSVNKELGNLQIKIEVYNYTSYVRKVFGSDNVPNTATANTTGGNLIRFRLLVASGNSVNITNLGIMLNEGSSALTYEPYVIPSINVYGEEIYNKPVTIITRQVVTYADQIGSAVFTIDYPTGFNADNTIVLALGYKYASDNQWKYGSIAGSDVNINPFFVTLNYNNENKIRIRFDDVEAEVNYNADFKIVLMRM